MSKNHHHAEGDQSQRDQLSEREGPEYLRIHSDEVTAETMFQAAWISKPVAATVSLKGVQNGLFSLDQDVNTISKSWKLPVGAFTKDRPVTLEV